MATTERRAALHHSCRELRRELNEAQRDALGELERYGWELKFVRHPLFQPVHPFVHRHGHLRGVRTAIRTLKRELPPRYVQAPLPERPAH